MTMQTDTKPEPLRLCSHGHSLLYSPSTSLTFRDISETFAQKKGNWWNLSYFNNKLQSRQGSGWIIADNLEAKSLQKIYWNNEQKVSTNKLGQDYVSNPNVTQLKATSVGVRHISHVFPTIYILDILEIYLMNNWNIPEMYQRYTWDIITHLETYKSMLLVFCWL